MATESRVLHVFADYPETLTRAAARYADVPLEIAEGWVRFGAVYCDGLRTLEDKPLRGGEYLRIHRQPRRFPTAAAIVWEKTIIAEYEAFLVVDKPAGVPIHPTLDNAHENVVASLERVRGERLFVTQRLDLPTSGLCVIARTKAFQSAFNRLLSEGAVTKRYRAIVQGTPALGRHIAYQEPSDRAPKRMALEAAPGWKRCALVLEDVTDRGDGTSVVTVLLETGRTHQIRAQLALLGHGLVGDPMYGNSPSVEVAASDDDEEEIAGALALRSFDLSFAKEGARYRWTLEDDFSRRFRSAT